MKGHKSARTKSLPRKLSSSFNHIRKLIFICCNLSQLFVFSAMAVGWEGKIDLGLWIFGDYYCVTLTVASLATTSQPCIMHQTPDFLQTLNCFPSYCLLKLEELHKLLVTLRRSFRQANKKTTKKKKKREFWLLQPFQLLCVRVKNISFHSSSYCPSLIPT